MTPHRAMEIVKAKYPDACFDWATFFYGYVFKDSRKRDWIGRGKSEKAAWHAAAQKVVASLGQID